MAAISAAIRLAGTIGGESAAAGAAGSGGMQGVTQAVGQLGGSASHASETVTKLATSLISAVHPLTYVNKGLDLFKTGLTAVLGPMDHFVGFFQELNSKYVGLFDPGRVKLFDMAVKDLYAVLGEQLSPITREATSVIKEMSAILNGLTPMVKEFVNAGLKEMQPAFRAVIDLTKEYIAASKPLIDIAAEIQLAQWQGLAAAIQQVAEGTQRWYEWLREILGLPAFQGKDAMGKAAANVSQTSTQGYLMNLQLGALKMGKGEDPAVKQVNLLGEIKGQLVQMVQNLPNAIKDGVKELPGALADAIVDRLPGGKEARVDLNNLADRARQAIPAFLG